MPTANTVSGFAPSGGSALGTLSSSSGYTEFPILNSGNGTNITVSGSWDNYTIRGINTEIGAPAYCYEFSSATGKATECVAGGLPPAGGGVLGAHEAQANMAYGIGYDACGQNFASFPVLNEQGEQLYFDTSNGSQTTTNTGYPVMTSDPSTPSGNPPLHDSFAGWVGAYGIQVDDPSAYESYYQQGYSDCISGPNGIGGPFNQPY